MRPRTEKPAYWCFASAFAPISDENRDGGRSLSSEAGKADSVSPFPARIALQGGETRGRRCDVSLPSARRRHFRELIRPVVHTWPLEPSPATNARLNRPYAIRAQTRQIRVLAEPFNNNKKWAQGQRRDRAPSCQLPPVSFLLCRPIVGDWKQMDLVLSGRLLMMMLGSGFAFAAAAGGTRAQKRKGGDICRRPFGGGYIRLPASRLIAASNRCCREQTWRCELW